MRKAILLAMAAAIVAMFAMPGSASANWTKHHVAANENATLEFTGTDLLFKGELGGVTCGKTISTVHFTQGTTTGTVTSFGVEIAPPETTITSTCQGTGAIQQCDVHEVTAHGLPWTIHTVGKNAAGEATVSVTTGTITNTATGFLCPHTPDLTPGTVHFSTSEVPTTSTATLSGSLKGDGPEQNVTVGGEVHVLGTITYGV